MNIEYGHIYIEDMLDKNWAEKIKDKLQKEIPFIKKFKGKKIVLIDDKDHLLKDEEKDHYKALVNNLYSDMGIKPDQIYFERDYVIKAGQLFDSIDDDLKRSIYFRKENKYVDIVNVNGIDIHVRERKNGNIKNYCVMLSTAWSIYKSECYGNNHVVLPEYYKKVENNVSLLLGLLSYQNNNKYFFY